MQYMVKLKIFFHSKEGKFFLLCMGIQLAWFVIFYAIFKGRNWDIYNDSGDYISIAKNLLANGTFATENASPDGSRTPLYPLFIALLGGRLWLISITQHIMVAFVSLFTYKIGKLLSLRNQGLWAGLLFALEPGVAIWTDQIVTEAFFTFLFITGIYYFIKGFKDKKYFYIASALFGLGALVRPILIVFGLPLIIFMLIWKSLTKQKLSSNKFRYKTIILCVIIFISIIFPWFLRNKSTFNVWSFDTVSRIVINAEATQVLSNHRNEPEAKLLQQKYNDGDKYIESNEYVGPYDHTPVSNQYFDNRIKETFKAFPVAFISLHLTGFIGFYATSHYDYYSDIVVRKIPRFNNLALLVENAGKIIWLLVPLLSLLGFIILFWNRKTVPDRLTLLLLLGTIMYFGLTTGSQGNGNDRFRYPIVSLMFLFMVVGYNYIYTLLRNKIKSQ